MDALERRTFAFISASVLLVASCFSQPAGSRGSALPPSEYDVKAAFLLNFTKFVEWPARRGDAPFRICIFGEDPFGAALEQMVEGERVDGRRIAVTRVRELPAACEVLFVAKSERAVARILADAGSGVLTVGETNDFLKQGGMIAFAVENHRVRFDVDQRAAEKGALRISSKLLNVARRVAK